MPDPRRDAMLRRSRDGDAPQAVRTSGEAARGRATSAAASYASRFERVWGRHVASPPSPEGATVYAELRVLLGAPYRRYHTLEHIHDCLRRLDDVGLRKARRVRGSGVSHARSHSDYVYAVPGR